MKYPLVIILAFEILSCSNAKQESLEHFQKSREFYEKDDIKNAVSEIDIAIQLDSSNLDFYLLQSKIFFAAENNNRAIQILNGLLNKNFKSDTINYCLGATYYSLGQYYVTKKVDDIKSTESYEMAIQHLTNTIDINPQFINAHVLKIKTLHNLNRYDEALIIANSAINLFPDNKSLILTRGVEKKMLGDISGALIDLNDCIQSNKLDSADMASAHRFRSDIYSDKGDFDSAINDLTQALEYNPQDLHALAERANCYSELGLKDKACEDYRKAAELGYVRLYERIKSYCNE